MEFIGQNNIKLFLNNLTLDNMPHSLMLKGEPGCGRHLVCNLIKDKLNLELVNITDNLSTETINSIYLNEIPTLYLIEGYNITEKNYNSILKLLEEPPVQSYIVLIEDMNTILLETIANRIIKIIFEKYSFDELKEFSIANNLIIEDKYINTLFNTPGDILNILNYNIKLGEVEKLISDIITRFKSTSLPTALTVLNRLNFKDNYDKIELNTFIKLLYIRLIDKYLETKDNYYFNMSNILQEYKGKLKYKKVEKQRLVTNLLIDMWREK